MEDFEKKIQFRDGLLRVLRTAGRTDPSEFDRDAIKKQLKEEHGLQFGRLRVVG